MGGEGISLKMEMVETEKIRPNERNEKKHTEQQIHRIARSIRKFGFVQPLVVDGKDGLIIGHARLLAAKRLRMEKVPVIRKENLSEKEIDELRIMDNKLNESPWDISTLKLHDTSFLIEAGFNYNELDRLFKDVKLGGDDEEETFIEDMMLHEFEKYDYIVFVFRNELDWLNALQKFKLPNISLSWSSKTKKVGQGRVLDGKVLLE
jgi:hypothetical protein